MFRPSVFKVKQAARRRWKKERMTNAARAPRRRQSAITDLPRRVINITETLNCGKNPLDNKAAEQETQVFQKCKPSVSGRGAAVDEASCIWCLSFRGLSRYYVFFTAHRENRGNNTIHNTLFVIKGRVITMAP